MLRERARSPTTARRSLIALAIRIHDEKGHKLGYVPQAKNEILARLMDAGKLVFGKLVEKHWHEEWLKLEIKVFMREV